ncbi:MAG TPA: ATP-binding cassette domain-containing protein, partial [Candidatus Competibacteraceae bacterium]|nr:ATP-binding cassette domain-containing protein [Candidatus Competibacteraceae bacterium]
MATEPLLIAEGVSLTIRGRTILSEVGLRVHAGEIVTLIGPNGAGKSMLVRVVLGLVRPDVGRVWRRPGLSVGYMPQRLTVDETLPLTVQRFLTLSTPASRMRVHEALTETGAAELLDSPLQAISGGEFQRVLLARALLRRPQLLVLDEP